MICAAHFRSLGALFLLGFITSLSLPSTNAQDQPARTDPYKKWLNEDVRWIISDQERTDFNKLWTDEQRDRFVVAFWERRNPTPGAPENAFKEEHYRRMAYSNERYAEGIPGWKTDRGHVYIKYGPPDKIDTYPDTTSLVRAQPLEGNPAPHVPFEVWYYRYIEGVGQDVIVEFVDHCQCGKYHLTVRWPRLGKSGITSTSQ
jgi:GWxTD domain-containing protein